MNKPLNKSVVTNLAAVGIILFGSISPILEDLIKSIGFFALSGAVTNWLAVYMLFEKVPYLYGSGVIPERFEEFKLSIKQLMMQQFFTVSNIEQFIQKEEQQGSKILNLDPFLNAVDYDKIYESLVSSIMGSSFGGMLMMMGGEEALVPLKEPFTEKMKGTLVDMIESDRFKAAIKEGLDAHKIGVDIIDKIETVIDKRLNELTPQLVKEMVESIIHEHLGWLVVWGGVFGGVMGFLYYIFV
ncbi:MAG: DUF445 domain-containing protein [Methylococcales bacterium]|nr:MAG: DUF445 domain-containing protein [Methylococcales bacterium]